jgi:hypothetical protein
MIRLFLGNRIIVLFLLPFILLSFYLLNNHFEYHKIDDEINFGFWNGLFQFSALATQISASILVLFNAIYLNYLYNNYDFQDRNTYVISLIYVILMSFYYSFYRLDGILISHTFIVLSLVQYFKLKQNADGKEAIFNSAFFLGCAASFHPPLILFTPVFIFMYLVIRPFIIREFIVFIVGIIAPLLFGITYLKWTGGQLSTKLILSKESLQIHKDFIIILIFILILLILSTLGIRNRIQKSSNRLKKQIQIIWLLIAVAICMGSIDFFFYQQIERFSLLIIPLAILLSYSFFNKRFGTISTILFYLTIAYAVIKFFIV